MSDASISNWVLNHSNNCEQAVESIAHIHPKTGTWMKQQLCIQFATENVSRKECAWAPRLTSSSIQAIECCEVTIVTSFQEIKYSPTSWLFLCAACSLHSAFYNILVYVQRLLRINCNPSVQVLHTFCESSRTSPGWITQLVCTSRMLSYSAYSRRCCTSCWQKVYKTNWGVGGELLRSLSMIWEHLTTWVLVHKLCPITTCWKHVSALKVSR